MDQRLVYARRSVGEALRLDGEHNLKDAYQQYLTSLIYMYQILLEDCRQRNDIRELQTKGTTRILRMAQQCTERVNELIGEETTTSGASSSSGQHTLKSSTSLPPDHGSDSPARPQQPPAAAAADTNPVSPPRQPSPLAEPVRDAQAQLPSAAVRVAQLKEQVLSSGASQSLPDVHGSTQQQQQQQQPDLRRYSSASASLSSDPSSSSPQVGPVASKLSPVDLARQRNQQLMVVYQARMKKLHASGLSAASMTRMNMTMMRQLQENMAIAKTREAALNQKIRERQQRIAEEHRRRLEEAKDPLDHKELALEVMEFENHLSWVKEQRKSIAESPEDSDCISAFVTQVFSTSDHPLAKKLGVFQYQIYHHLLPLAKQGAPSTSSYCQAPDGTGLAAPPCEPVSSRLSPDTPADCLKSKAPKLSRISSDSSMDDDEGTLAAVLDVLGIREPGASDSGTLPSVPEDASASAFGLPVQKPRSDSTSSSPLPRRQDSIPSSPGHVTQHTILEFGTSLCSEKELDLAEVCALALKEIIKDVHNAIDLLEVALLVVYEELRTSTGRDQCRLAIEMNLFPPLWSLLLDVLRLANVRKEKAFMASLSVSRQSSLAEMGVAQNFQLCFDEKESEAQPYEAAINELQRITTLSVPLEKLECVVAVSRRICTAVEDYFVSIGKSRLQASIGCDDLLPILGYCIVRAAVPQLASECAAMEEFIHEGYLMGEEGYCLTTMLTALSHVSSLALPRPSPSA